MKAPRSLKAAIFIFLAVPALLLIYLKWSGRHPLDASMPPGAAVYLEVRRLEALWDEFSTTAACRMIGGSCSADLLNRTAFMGRVREFQRQWKDVAGFSLGPERIFDLAGREAAIALYRVTDRADGESKWQWVAAFRMNLRAWSALTGYRLWTLREGKGDGSGAAGEEGELLSWSTGNGLWPKLYSFSSGELLLAGTDPSLLRDSLEIASGKGGGLGGEKDFRNARDAMAGEGEIDFWIDTERAGGEFSSFLPGRGVPELRQAMVTAELGKKSIMRWRAVIGDRGNWFGHAANGEMEVLRYVPEEATFVSLFRGVPLPARLFGQAGAGSEMKKLPAPIEEWGLFVKDFDDRRLLPQPGWAFVAAAGSEEGAGAVAGSMLPGVAFRREALKGGEAWHATLGGIPAGEVELAKARIGNYAFLGSKDELLGELLSPGRQGGTVKGDDLFFDLKDLPDDAAAVVWLDAAKATPALQRYALFLAGYARGKTGVGEDILNDLELIDNIRSVAALARLNADMLSGRIDVTFGD